ncbi:MAG: M23 family metallopeptidase [Polyangiaceae bacterium]
MAWGAAKRRAERRSPKGKLSNFRGLGAGAAVLLLTSVLSAACGQTAREAVAPSPSPGLPAELASDQDDDVDAAVEAAAEEEAASATPPAPSVGWVLPLDYGIRADKAGQGQFLAPRYHGMHNGVDLLAPVGTPILAACSGEATQGMLGGYGRVVKLVCPVPADWGSGYLSFFYSHLSKQNLTEDVYTRVELGQELGAVGKSGNAAGPSVMPHLHLELIVQPTERAAKDERHSGRDQSDNAAADALLANLEERCLKPAGVQVEAGLRRHRRLDPYVVLSCLGAKKPEFTPAQGALRGASTPWHALYTASDANPDISLLPSH